MNRLFLITLITWSAVFAFGSLLLIVSGMSKAPEAPKHIEMVD